jgi:hypothetical protein
MRIRDLLADLLGVVAIFVILWVGLLAAPVLS